VNSSRAGAADETGATAIRAADARGINRRGNYGHRENEFHRVGAMRAFELWVPTRSARRARRRASVSAKPWGSRSPLSKRPCWRTSGRAGVTWSSKRRDARGGAQRFKVGVQRAKNNFRVSGGLGQPEGMGVPVFVLETERERELGGDVLGRAQLERETVDQPSQDEEERFQRFDGVSNSIAAKNSAVA